MKQYEPCIQNDNNNNNIIIIKLLKKNQSKWAERASREKGSMERENYFIFFFSLFLSQIYEN